MVGYPPIYSKTMVVKLKSKIFYDDASDDGMEAMVALRAKGKTRSRIASHWMQDMFTHIHWRDSTKEREPSFAPSATSGCAVGASLPFLIVPPGSIESKSA